MGHRVLGKCGGQLFCIISYTMCVCVCVCVDLRPTFDSFITDFLACWQEAADFCPHFLKKTREGKQSHTWRYNKSFHINGISWSFVPNWMLDLTWPDPCSRTHFVVFIFQSRMHTNMHIFVGVPHMLLMPSLFDIHNLCDIIDHINHV